MRQAVICAALIAWGLDSPLGAPVGEEDPVASGELGVPWVVSAEYGGYSLLKAPSDAPGSDGYQLRMVHGVTAQPWRILQAHAAWRYRETMAPGFTRPYREPLGAQGSVAVEAVPGLVFGWVGMSWPLLASQAPLADSAAWDAFASRHATLPDPAIVDPATVQVGGILRLQTDPTLFLAGVAYQLPTAFTALEGHRFRPPWILRMSLQCDMPLVDARQRLRFQGALFGPERTREGHEAHVESPVFGLRYSAEGLGADGRWAAAIGFLARLRDSNRRVMLDIPPVTSEENDNMQRGHFEVARRLKSTPLKFTWILLNRSEAKWQAVDRLLYLENTVEVRLVRRVFSGHGLDMRGSALVGSNLDGFYYGLGGKLVFTLRHMGLGDKLGQDVP
jgi:hypothetical protein